MPRAFPQTKFVGKQHRHGCIECRRTYCCACEDTNVAKRCNSCISGRLSSYAHWTDPAPCCTSANIRPARKDERERYVLAGQDSWFLCRTCFRSYSCNPEQVGRHDPTSH